VTGRLMDVLLAFPGILLAIALVAVARTEPDARRTPRSVDWLGGLRAACARSGPEGSRTRVRAGRPCPWRITVACPVPARRASHHVGGDRPGDARDGRGDHRGSVTQFSRWACSRRHPVGARCSMPGARICSTAAPDDLPWTGNCRGRTGFTFAGEALRTTWTRVRRDEAREPPQVGVARVDRERARERVAGAHQIARSPLRTRQQAERGASV
jgi:hypothetical protein